LGILPQGIRDSTMTQLESIREEYRRKEEECEREIARRGRQDVWFGRLRVATFLPAMGLIYYGISHGRAGDGWIVAGALFVVAFIVVVRIHEQTMRRAAELRQRLQINETQLARIDRRWDRVPAYNIDVPTQFEHIADDLDLFSHASLYQLISQAHTPFGRETLRDWLLVPASPAEIADRQQAVAFLAPATDAREEIALRGRMLSVSDQDTLAFVAWAEAPPVLAARSWLKWLTRLSSISLVLILIAAIAGLMNVTGAFLAIAAIVFMHIILIAVYAGRIYDVLDRIASRSHDIRQYGPLFETIAALPPEVPLFAKLHARMGGTPREPLDVLASLTRLVRFANLRRDGLSGIPYYLSQPFVLTDFHVVAALENWKQRHGSAVRRWLEAVGRLEAISSLGTLAHDNPQWTMPTVEPRPEKTIVARQLGHPLIADKVCVHNDVEIGPPGTFVLVTGSNMSGKSTLLRAVGVNLILAQAGAPVCAAQLRMPPVELATSMRTRDSLAAGVSFFLAELYRLKQIVDQSSNSRQRSQLLVYLLDEILQGTNSVERHIAVSRIIGHLIAHGSMGMVTTHDLELAHGRELAANCQAVHFRESITSADGDERMTFDYVLRSGLAPTTNALKLLKLFGLDD
jgi:ABC-type multidrug transport system fused ATPase/permease subunit